MRDWRTPNSGNFLRWKGADWVISASIDGVLHLVDTETDATAKLAMPDFQKLCSEGAAEMIERPGFELPEDRRALAETSFASMSPSMQREVRRMRRYVEAYLDPAQFYISHMPGLPNAERAMPDRMSKDKVVPLLEHVADSFEPRDRAPGFTTFAGWMRRWRQYKDWKLMAPRFDRRGSDVRTVVTGPMKRIVDKAIAKVWMTRTQLGKKDVFEEIQIKVSRYNERHLDARIGVSDRQVRRYMADEIDKYEEAVARKGKAWADGEFRPVFQGPRPDRIMAVVEVDHTQAKIEVTDDVTGRNLGRPWVTTALDRGSRVPAGLHFHFEGQTLHAVFQCLRNAMLPKGFLKTLVPELDYKVTFCGRPVSFFFDRGKDFDNDHVEEVGISMDIRMLYAPGEHPEYKASIERFFGTLHRKTSHPLKGAMPRVKSGDGGRRPRKSEATMPFSDFVERTWRWATMVYVKEWHEGLNDTPLNVWNQGMATRAPRPPPSLKEVDACLMRAVRCEATAEGFQYAGLRWNGDVVTAIRARPEHRRGELILIRIDDGDVGRAFVEHPATGLTTPLLPALPKYMRGLTMHEHEVIRTNLARKRKGVHGEASLLAAKERLRAEALASFAMGGTKSKTMARIARLLRVGMYAPSGDDLGSLDPRRPAPGRDRTAEPAQAPAPAGAPPAAQPEPRQVPAQAPAPVRRRAGPPRVV